MPLETSGFQLSQFDRAPQVPSNIGVVDTKSIYGAVVDALKTNEALRTTQQVQAMNDAETALATQRARGQLEILPSTLEAEKAKAQLLAAKAPYEMGLLPLEDQARRQELEAQRVKSKLLSDETTARKAIERTLMTQSEINRQRSLEVLADPNASANARQAAAINLGFEAKAVQPGFGYTVVTGNDGSQRLVITSRNAPGAYDIASGTGVGVFSQGLPQFSQGLPPARLPLSLLQRSAAPAAVAPSAAAPAAAPTTVTPLVPTETGAAAPAQAAAPATGGLILTPAPPAPEKIWLGPSVSDKATQTEIAQAKGKALEQLPKLNSALRSMEQKIVEGERDLERAKVLLDTYSDDKIADWYRSKTRDVAGTDAFNIEKLLTPVRTNIFVDNLSEMRNSSPTGGAVGNVTDVEGAKLEASKGSLDLGQSKAQLLQNIENVRESRRKTLENLKLTIQEYQNFLGDAAPKTAANQPSIDDLVKKHRTKK